MSDSPTGEAVYPDDYTVEAEDDDAESQTGDPIEDDD
jgi:hypothetical protein